MKNKTLFKTVAFATLLSFLLFFSNSVSADFCSYLTDEVGVIPGVSVPNSLPYKNEITNVYTLDREVVGMIVIKDGKIESTSCNSTTENATYNLFIKDQQTIEDILSSEKPVDVLNEKIKSQDIILEGTKTSKKIKGFFTRLAIRLTSWFS